MKDSYIDIITIRRKVFTKIAELAYNDADLSKLNREIYKLLPGEMATYRESIFRERAVIGERLRMALGLRARTAAETGAVTEGIEEVDVDRRVYSPPLVEVIKIACEACPERHILVTDNCRKCLAHPCVNVCPKEAVSIGRTQAEIDQDKCIKCGRCVTACPYHAIVDTDRPCSAACGVKAIGSDYLNRAEIDQDKCVACGACITACPFGAIADKSELYQLIRSIKRHDDVYAIIAPSFVSQFGSLVKPAQVFEAIRELGIKDVIEVGMGADLTTLNEAEEFLEHVPSEKPFLGTSCCYSWKLMVQKMFPEQNPYISESSTPMVYTARQIKERHPGAKIVFIGPCLSKKLEALQDHVKGFVDFVITFEELMGMFVAREIEPSILTPSSEPDEASATGRAYAYASGVAAAVESRIHEIDPDAEVRSESVEGLENCVKLMRLAKAGRKDGMLLEGMACFGGCIGGPGTLVPLSRAKRSVEAFAKQARFKSPADNSYLSESDKPKRQEGKPQAEQ